MALLSKYVEQLSHFYYNNKFSNNNNNNKLLPKQIGHAVIGTAVILYTFKLTYPLIFKSQQQQQPPEQQQHDNDVVDELTTTNINLDELKALEAEKLLQQQKQKQQQTSLSSSLTSDEPALNGLFIRNLLKLLRIMIPRSICHETGLLAVHSLCLISRTFLSIYVAALEGELVKYIVRKDVRQFRWVLIKWFGIAVPATFINSMIRFLESKLALAFRTRLVRHSYRLYFKNQNYYRVSNLDGRIENADHRLTEDISVFTSSIAHLYGSLTKPIFDLMLIGLTLMRSSRQLRANIFFGPALAVTVISLTGHIMRIASPKFGQLVSEEANRYAYLRHIHSRIITNAEEIAFYGGHKVELNQLSQAYNRLVTQMNVIFKQKLWFIMLEQFFMKYVWSGTGMIMVSLPILTTTTIKTTTTTTTNSNDVISERTRYLTTARNLLISAADAIERLMSSYKEIVTLAGYTFRVAGMLQVFEETANGNYIRDNFVQLNNNNNNNNKHHLIEIYDGRPLAKGSVIYAQNPQDMRIELHDVPVVTPNCDVVVPSLTLELAPGMHLLITGPNGCGKSSLFRILSGLWPIYAGELRVPQPIEGKPCMFYIPQRPYMSIGSLCDQIIYPDTQLDMERKNVTKADLMTILKMVSLEHIAQRDSFELVRDWKDILSGGEKQRMAIARLFYHKPKYALLDECTSAVSIDVENSIYENAKNMGITLLTITHRPSLWKFHTHVLEFDGLGGWKFRTMEMATHEQQQQI